MGFLPTNEPPNLFVFSLESYPIGSGWLFVLHRITEREEDAVARGQYKEWLTKDGLLRIESWARDGLTDEQIAKNIGIVTSTFYVWKNKYPEFSDALKKGKRPIDVEVENTLLKVIHGYEYQEKDEWIEVDDMGQERRKVVLKTRYAKPDTTAIIFWLKARKPDIWRGMTKEFKEKLKAETEHLKADTKLKQHEAKVLDEEVAGGDQVFFIDSSEEMEAWLREHHTEQTERED